MIITNINEGQFVKVQSDIISEVINDINSYSSIEVGININCCNIDGVLSKTTDTIPLDEPGWHLDLGEAVELESTLRKLYFQNLTTGSQFNVILTTIDLGYVNDNCSSNTCYLSSFDGHFNSLFKDQIDDWFASVGIVANVTVAFDENTVIITNLPAGWILSKAEYGAEEPYTIIPGGYGSSIAKVFLGSDGLYIKPELFSLDYFLDGVYRIEIRTNKEDNSWKLETGCSFIDINTKCQVAGKLADLKESFTTNSVIEENQAMLIFAAHYALTNASNCNCECNCNDMCSIYYELYTLLNGATNKLNPCAC